MTFGLGFTAYALTDNPALAAFASIPAYASDLARADLSLVVAMELSAVTAADIGNSGKFYLSSETFATTASDSPASRLFDGRIRSCVIRRTIEPSSDGQLAGGIIRAFGEVELDNADGGLDDLLTLWYVDGRDVVIKVAGKASRDTTRAYSSFGTVFTGHAGQWSFERAGDSVRLRLESINRQLRRAIATTTYDGNGSSGGTEDLAGVSKPQAYGICYNVSPQLVDPTVRSYQVHDDFIESVIAVYDSGVELQGGGLYSNYAALTADTIPDGSYGVSRPEGFIALGLDPVGQVTMDLEGDRSSNRRPAVESWSDGTTWSDGTGWGAGASQIPVQGVAQAIWRILEERGGFTSAQINESAFYRFDRLQPAQVGYHVPAGDTDTIETHIQRLAASAGGAVGPDQYNRLILIRVDAPSDNSPYTLDSTNIVSLERATVPYAVPWYIWRLGYRINWTVQSDSQLAEGVSLSRRAQLKRLYRLTTNRDDDILETFPASGSIETLTYFVELEDAQAERSRRQALYSVGRIMLRVAVKTYLFRIELGETVKVTYDRFDLDSGRYFTVLEVEEDLAEQTTRLLLFG